tara:strand:- start:12 stop:599 length:588 start_codon:yes stop_codon:yes gene_type:complete
MAFSNLEKAMATFIGLDIVRPGTSRTAAKMALGALIRATQIAAPVAARGIATAVPAIGTAAAAAPVATGAALGLGALATPPGQMLLESARERGRADRDAFDAMLATGEAFVRSPTGQGQIRTKVRKTVSKYNKAVKAGMKAVKASKFGGKKGTIRSAKTTFGTVNKVVSAVNKGKKVSTKGIRGTIARAARKVLK